MTDDTEDFPPPDEMTDEQLARALAARLPEKYGPPPAAAPPPGEQTPVKADAAAHRAWLEASVKKHAETKAGRATVNMTAVADAVYRQQLASLPGLGSAALINSSVSAFRLMDVIKDAGCKDPLEEMLVTQMVWTHARTAHLNAIANQQKDVRNVRAVSEQADKASNTFRRLMLALAEYRSPRKAATFVKAGQANVAHQQIVNGAPSKARLAAAPKNPNGKPANELGSAAAVPALPKPPAVPALARGAGVAAGGSPPHAAVGAVHWAADGGGKG